MPLISALDLIHLGTKTAKSISNHLSHRDRMPAALERYSQTRTLEQLPGRGISPILIGLGKKAGSLNRLIIMAEREGYNGIAESVFPKS
ncbi:MAG: hypothetical protein KDB22_26750 [Planctomycetales bacterium]|nr:hypothetical protein [Planctomycetales bacterium]